MALIIQKFGGTSVGTPERIKEVASKVAETRAQGHDIVVVVSAMNGETDRLIKMAHEIHKHPDPREYAVLVSTGEQVSISLLTMALIAKGCAARSYTGTQAQIRTDDDYKKARIIAIDREVLQHDISAGLVPVIAGFQGISGNGDITTLGRGGSDTTAVAVAAALNADECQIYTDVDGVYTADPRIVPDAKRLAEITFPEMLELASLGAKVMQQRAVEFAGQYKIPLRVLSSFAPGPGTLINFTEKGEDSLVVTGIACNRHEAQFTINTMSSAPEAQARILSTLAAENIDVDMLVQQALSAQTMNFMFTTHRDDYPKALTLIEKLESRIGTNQIIVDSAVAKISLVGMGLRSHTKTISTLFDSLSRHNIRTQLFAMSEMKASVIIGENNIEQSMRVLHTAYGLDKVGNNL